MYAEGEASAKVKKVADRSAGTRSNFRNVPCAALLDPRVGRLRVVKYSAMTSEMHPAAVAARNHDWERSGSNCENHATAIANPFSPRSARHQTGSAASQLRKRFDRTMGKAAQKSAEVKPSFGAT